MALRVVAGPPSWQVDPTEHQAPERQRHVDAEDRAPAAETDQQPADGRADDGEDLVGDGQCREHALGAVDAGAVGLAADQRHRGRVGRTGTEAEEHACQDEDAEGRRQHADQARDADQCRRHEEERAGAELVDEAADDGLSHRGGEVQARDQPHRLRGRGPEGRPDRHERDGDHRAVDRVERRPEDQRRDQPPVEPGGSGSAHADGSRSSSAIASRIVRRSAGV